MLSRITKAVSDYECASCTDSSVLNSSITRSGYSTCVTNLNMCVLQFVTTVRCSIWEYVPHSLRANAFCAQLQLLQNTPADTSTHNFQQRFVQIENIALRIPEVLLVSGALVRPRSWSNDKMRNQISSCVTNWFVLDVWILYISVELVRSF